MIHDGILNFHDWILCCHEPFQDKMIKINGTVNYLWHWNNMKVTLTAWTTNYVDRVPFSCIGSFYIVHSNQAN